MQLFPSPTETIGGATAELSAGRLTCVGLLERCLARIDEWEPQVHAWVGVDRDAALLRAGELDEEIRAGRSAGPLHGIPIGIKDIVDVAGSPTGAGSALLSTKTVEADAPLVARLRAAGAIILGKTVTTQFACFDPPVTRNPWNTDHTPGGSSSGSAAAVATGMCLGAIGSQTGGSISRPAAFCGVAGCKPTFGRVSTQGVVPVAANLDHPGPIARCVHDLAVMLDVIAGNDSPEHDSAHNKLPEICAALDAGRLQPPTIGRLRGFFEDLAESSALNAVDQAVAKLAAAGAEVIEPALPPSFADLHRAHRTIMAFEMAGFHEQRLAEFPDDYLGGVCSLIEEGLAIAQSDYEACRQHQRQARYEISLCFDNVDVLFCPAALGPAPDCSTTGNPAFNSPWSYAGLPTISLPVSLADNGLPLAIQIVGRAFAEAELFRSAAWVERVLSV